MQAACGGSHTMALTDKGHMFIWGRCSNGRMGFAPSATVELPHEIQLPGGAERWHPICVAAGGRHSMCMALPRHTVTDHERRLTYMSDTGSSLGGPGSFEERFHGASPNMPIRVISLLLRGIHLLHRAVCSRIAHNKRHHMDALQTLQLIVMSCA